jgi:hypothetical protein
VRLSLYFDEDSMDQALVRALTARGVDVASALTEGMIKRPDREHLLHATSLGRVLYSFNIADFCRLHSELLNEGEHHAGLILGQQQRYSVGQQMRRLLAISASLSAEEMHDRLEFMGSW